MTIVGLMKKFVYVDIKLVHD